MKYINYIKFVLYEIHILSLRIMVCEILRAYYKLHDYIFYEFEQQLYFFLQKIIPKTPLKLRPR